MVCWDFSGCSVVKTLPSNAGLRVQFFIGQLRLHMLHGQKKQSIKQKHMVHIQKKKKKKTNKPKRWGVETVQVDNSGELSKTCLFQTLLQDDLGRLPFLQLHFRQCPASFSRRFSCFSRFYCFFLNLSSCPLPIASTRMDGKKNCLQL